MTRDLAALGFANGCVLAAGHGVLRAMGLRPALNDLPWSLGVAYIAGAAAVGVLGSALLVAGLELTWWQILLLCAAIAGTGSARRGELRRPALAGGWIGTGGWIRLLPLATAATLAVLAVDLAVQPIWADDAWAIWAIKAASIVELGGLTPRSFPPRASSTPTTRSSYRCSSCSRCASAACPTSSCRCSLGSPSSRFPPRSSRCSAIESDRSCSGASCSRSRWRPRCRDSSCVGRRGGNEGGGRGLRRPALRRSGDDGAHPQAAARAGRRGGVRGGQREAGGAGSVDLLDSLDRIPRAAAAPSRELADPSAWLALVALSIGAIVLAFVRRERRAAALYTLFVTGSSLAGLLTVYWTTPLDFDYHLATFVRRVITAPVLFAAAMTPLLLSRGQQPR